MAGTNEKPGCLGFFFPSLKKSQPQPAPQSKGEEKTEVVAEAPVETAQRNCPAACMMIFCPRPSFPFTKCSRPSMGHG
jgi:hypothetical protein